MNYPRIERPMEGGQTYFYRPFHGHRWVALWVYFQRDSMRASWPGREYSYAVNVMTGEWRGPIPQPDSEQKEVPNGQAL